MSPGVTFLTGQLRLELADTAEHGQISRREINFKHGRGLPAERGREPLCSGEVASQETDTPTRGQRLASDQPYHP